MGENVSKCRISKVTAMMNEEYIRNHERFVRVNKRVARRMYDKGKRVFLIPDMMRLNNAWQSPCPISKEDNGGDRSFDARVNEYRYYNCDNERGRGVKYFVSQEDLGV